MTRDSFDDFEETESIKDYNINEFDQISGIDIEEANK